MRRCLGEAGNGGDSEPGGGPLSLGVGKSREPEAGDSQGSCEVKRRVELGGRGLPNWSS